MAEAPPPASARVAARAAVPAARAALAGSGGAGSGGRGGASGAGAAGCGGAVAGATTWSAPWLGLTTPPEREAVMLGRRPRV
jgi:hypothetical protein